MITDLSKEQESKISYYFNKWKDIGFSNKRIDRRKQESKGS